MSKRQLTISLSGAAASGKTITAELLHAFFTQNGIQSKLQSYPNHVADLSPSGQARLTQHLRDNVEILIVDYQT